jgi:hypothetical protein
MIKQFRLQVALATLFMLAGFKSGKSHPFHVSICQIDVVSGQLQITHKIFRDDLELEINRLYDRDLDVENDRYLLADTLFSAYLKEHFHVAINGNRKSSTYIGHEIDFDVVWMYIEIPLDEEIESIAVKNEILLGTYDDQTNLVHVDFRGETKSMLLNGKKNNAVIQYP